MKENRAAEINKEKTEALQEVYKNTLNILDAYDHQTLVCPKGTYYDGYETVEEAAVNMLYDMVRMESFHFFP